MLAKDAEAAAAASYLIAAGKYDWVFFAAGPGRFKI
jgi:hypothetical protein